MENDSLTKTESTYEEITAAVTYRTRYIEKDCRQALLTIGLGNVVAVNTLLVLPTFCSCKNALGITKDCTISDAFNIWFPIVFQSVYSGLPKVIEF